MQYLHGQIDNPIYYVARDNKQLEERFNEIYYVNEGDKNEDNNGISIERSNFIFNLLFKEILAN